MIEEEKQEFEKLETEEPWIPKTKIGKEVLEGKIKSIDEIFERGEKIKEPEIVDRLLKLKTEIIWIGGSPGKGGGIKRTPTRRTARMHRSGRRYKISSLVVVGDENGHVGVGKGVGVTHQIAIEKAIRKAKLNIIPILRGCGSWRCRCDEQHSIKRKTKGKAGSVRIVLMPAPRGAGLVCSDELKKLFMLAGIKDILTKSFGKTKTRFNHVLAAFDALKKLNSSR